MSQDNQEQTVTSTPTGGTETILQLTQAVKRHAGDFPAWQRTGRQLAVRRTLLGYPDGKRQRFVDERCRPGDPDGLTYKNVYELEHGPRWGRKAFPVHWLIAASDAYAVVLWSFAASPDGGDLEPAPPASLPARDAPPLQLLSSDPPLAVRMSGVLSDAAIAAAAPHATEILMRLRDLAVAGIMRPSGRQLFADSDEDAAIWDRNADEMPDDELAWLIAGRRVLETSARRLDRTVS